MCIYTFFFLLIFLLLQVIQWTDFSIFLPRPSPKRWPVLNAGWDGGAGGGGGGGCSIIH